MIVGQGPGKREDMAGEAFIGPSGQLLDAMLRDAGYDPTEVYVTNATRCRAPDDRQPYPSEVDACRPYLEDEIRRIDPEVIVAMGDAAMRSLLKLGGVQSKRGQAFGLHNAFGDLAGREVYPTYHPAYVLRYPMARNVVVSDLRRVRDRTKAPAPVPWVWWEGQVIPPGPVGFDIETDYDRKTKRGGDALVQAAIATKDCVYVAHERAYELIKQLEGRSVFTLNGWDFDNPKCRALGLLVPHGIDVMALAYLDDEQQPLGLESLAVKYLQVRGWKDERDAPVGSDEFALYNARDAWYTLQLAAHLYKILGTSTNGVPRARLVTDIMSGAREALDACSIRGIRINAGPVAVANTRFSAQIADKLAAIREQVADSKHNPNSPAQVGAILEQRGYYLPATETGKPSTSAGVLNMLPQDDAYVQALLAYREAQKRKSTYIDPYQKIIETPDGRAHPEYTIWRTVTNRTSARNPNVQNLDRTLKDFLDVDSVDYSSIEFRLAAWCAREETILTRFRDNPEWDPHIHFARTFYADATIQTANLLAMYAGIPTERTGAEVLRILCAALGTTEEAREILTDLHRTGWRGVGELPAWAGAESPFVREREQLLQKVGQERVREVRNWLDAHGWTLGTQGAEPFSASSRSQQAEQYTFKLGDALQALSSASSYFLTRFDAEWKHRRQVAKSGNFSQIYLGNGFTLQNYAADMGIKLDRRTSDRAHEAWHAAFPGFRAWYVSVFEELKEKGYVETATGHRRHYGDFSLLRGPARSAALREAVNLKVQSLACHVALLGLNACHQDAMPINGFIHDAITFEPGYVLTNLDRIRHNMVVHPVRVLRERFRVDLDVPLTVEAAIARK